MDKKGQATVIFIILIPVFLVLTAIIIDTGLNLYNEKKLKNVTSDVLEVIVKSDDLANVTYENEEEVLNNLTDKAIIIYEENKMDTDDLFLEIMYGGRIKISNNYTYYSFMNSLFNKGNGMRQITIEAEAYLDEAEVVIEFKDGSNED